jgi:hypothetical protein
MPPGSFVIDKEKSACVVGIFQQRRPKTDTELLFLDGLDGAVLSAGAAADTNVGIDDVLLVALGDSLDGAVLGAGAALDASISDLVSHDSFLHVYVVGHSLM